MTDAWFSPEVARWFSFLSLLALFSLVHPLAEQGRFKSMVMSTWIAVLCMSGCLLAVAGVGAASGQPAHVVKTLALTAVLIGTLFAGTMPSLRRTYREAELRKTIAADL